VRVGEAASASVAAAAAGVAVIVLAGVMAIDVGLYAAARARAVAAADAAALAAAPVTFRSFGAGGGPQGEASRFAAANGAELVRCDCPADPSWAGRTVEATVSIRVDLIVLGDRAVTATSRAEFIPAEAVVMPAQSSSMVPSSRSR